MESNYEKVDKLLEIRDSARTRLKAAESEIDAEKQVRINVELAKSVVTFLKPGTYG